MTIELSGFQLQAKFFPADATALREPDSMASIPLANVDWSPGLEFAKWKRACRDPRLPIVLDQAEGMLEPSWDQDWGRPYIQGIKVVFGDERSPAEFVTLPLIYFSDAAKDAATELVAAGQLAVGDPCLFRICAHPTTTRNQPDNVDSSALQVQPIVEPLALQEGGVSNRLQRAMLGDDQPENGMPVFLPASVLAETHRLTHAAGSVETGGLLIGHLGIDRAIPEIFLEVTAQIPAIHARQELTSLTLTPQTWAAVDAAVQLRGQGERYLGWWHSHPVSQWCADCPEQKRRNCQLRCDFFSAQDKAVHRCCFSRAFQVAMVVSDNGAVDLSTALFGWREGTIQRRGFHVIKES